MAPERSKGGCSWTFTAELEGNLKQVFLSYSAKDRAEVDAFDREMRRRGVPVWRDRRDLTGGRATRKEIEKAFQDALGTVFFLTENAAESEWVRETERRLAQEANARWFGHGIFPVFRHDRREITQAMQNQAADRAALDAYDLSTMDGYVVKTTESPTKESLIGEFRKAARRVLGGVLKSLDESKATGAALRIGLATRGAITAQDPNNDLLADWSADFPGVDGGPSAPPSPEIWAESLLPALADLQAEISTPRRSGRRAVVLVPQCHLTLALAAGFQFRRNVQVDVSVIEPNTGSHWTAPRLPEPGNPAAWTVERLDLGAGKDVALVVNVTQPPESVRAQLRSNVESCVGSALIFEPAGGPSFTWLSGLDALEPHRRAMAVVERVRTDEAYPASKNVHLYFAGPAAFAVLLAQQFSNLRSVQTYEWLNSEQRYVPGPRLISS